MGTFWLNALQRSLVPRPSHIAFFAAVDNAKKEMWEGLGMRLLQQKHFTIRGAGIHFKASSPLTRSSKKNQELASTVGRQLERQRIHCRASSSWKTCGDVMVVITHSEAMEVMTSLDIPS